MNIEEILKAAGITDENAISAVKTELPKNFVPLSVLNERIASAKNDAAQAHKELEEYKAQAEQEKAEARQAAEDAKAQAEELQTKYAELEEQYNGSKSAIRERDAKSALAKALEGAGANPSAIDLLANAGLAAIEYGEDDTPANVDAVLENLKGSNAGLFGVDVDTGKQSGKADEDNKSLDPFLKGFGEL